ncbi:MAG: B12-binding domain-containing radical SAM protein, partial [Thermoplasmatota archaeon]
LLITPPFMHCNTPYAATPYLAGYLKQQNQDVTQFDASLELMLRLLSSEGVQLVYNHLDNHAASPSVNFFNENIGHYASTINPVMRFLQGKDPSLALRIVAGGYLPEGPRFAVLNEYTSAYPEGVRSLFGVLGTEDWAVYLASLYCDDIFDVVSQGIDSSFGVGAYSSRLESSFQTFDPLIAKLERKTLIDAMLEEITDALLVREIPSAVAFTIPFPSCLYGALRMAKRIKQQNRGVAIVFGGGYVTTELRQITEPRLFDYCDFLCLDDGMRPLATIIEHLRKKTTQTTLLRTFTRDNGQVVFHDATDQEDVSFSKWPAPQYDGLQLNNYFSLAEMANPMHRLWNRYQWNKMVIAHGCYWHGCAFCDTSIDYICRYEIAPVKKLVDNIEEVVAQTGQTGFHFVDEALPPKVLRKLAAELLHRDLSLTWWGNIRFEPAFTDDFIEELAAAGCIAVTGGLEAVSDRLLTLLNKGTSFAQMAAAAKRFSNAGIMVHAYLMYGVPSQTAQETIDALERVRQLFVYGCIHSAYWHRFSTTAHSSIGLNPESYGITLHQQKPGAFAHNDIQFSDAVNTDHDMLGTGLNKALYNYMHGIGLEEKLEYWFDVPVPLTKVSADAIVSDLKKT